jgi:uncharacterized protein (TIGR02271 family)
MACVKMVHPSSDPGSNVPVELKSEHVVIERIPANEGKGTGATSLNEERIEIPLSREEAVVEKVSQVTGRVRPYLDREKPRAEQTEA